MSQRSVPVTVSGRILGLIAHVGSRRGVDAGAVLAALGIDARVLAAPDARVPIAHEDALWEAMAAATRDPYFGLHAAESMPEGSFDVMEYAIRTSATARAALEAMIRYNRLVHDVAELDLRDDRDPVLLTHRFRGHARGASLHAADFTVAVIVLVLRQLTGTAWRPLHVALAHAPCDAPEGDAPYRALLGCPVSFGATESCIHMDRAVLDLPVRSANPGLHDVLRRHAESLLAALPRSDGLVERCRDRIAEALPRGVPSLAAVARALHMSPRTLQRRLDAEGVRFQALVDAMRRELADRYLGDTRLSIAEVAYLLGFSEVSAFHRACKRWSGKPPGQLRRGISDT